MSKTVLKVENISKQYRLGQVGTGTLSHDLNRWWHRIRRKEDPYLKIGEVNDRTKDATSEYVWALKDINFEVKEGEVLGIIGKNGAGKSTLLKILSKVTGPTTGCIKTNGRIASLLEVGTGFHPELTGRENIFLNGAILGMTKSEVSKKLDEIVDFAGVARYLDTPVKRYSSGMMVRLGFAVAAHLEPEILIVDEVLAVGDAEFQKKAIGKMQEVSTSGGRTVLFVSHNMESVKNLCERGMVLADGKLGFLGSVNEAVINYLSHQSKEEVNKTWEEGEGPTNPYVSLLAASVNGLGKEPGNIIVSGEGLELKFSYRLMVEDWAHYSVTFHLLDEMNNLVFVGGSGMIKELDFRSGNGIYFARCIIPEGLMHEGNYRIGRLLFVKNKGSVIFETKDILGFNIIRNQEMKFGWQGKKEGVVRPALHWEIIYPENKIDDPCN